MHALSFHPRQHSLGAANGDASKMLIRFAAGDVQQILPIITFRIGTSQRSCRFQMHGTQVASMAPVAAAKLRRRVLECQTARASLACRDGGAQRSVPPANDKDVNALIEGRG